MTVSDCFSANVASCNTHSTDVKSADVIIAMAHSTLFTTSVKNIDITLAEVYHGYMTLDTLPKIPAHFASLCYMQFGETFGKLNIMKTVAHSL